MRDQRRLIQILRSAMREALERRAGLPRITITDKPKKQRRRREWDQTGGNAWTLQLKLL